MRLDGTMIGRVETHHLDGARSLFYFSHALHPESGEEHRLEGGIDFEERVDVVRRFWLDPMQFPQHLGIRR